MRKLFVFVACLGILAFPLLACGESSNNTGTATSSNSKQANAQAPAPTQHFKVGDTVKVGTTWQAVVNSVKTDDGGQYSALKSGDVYLLVDLSLTNLSNQEQSVSSELNFTLQDATGQKYNESIDSNAGATLDGKVEVGQPLRGIIAFEVPSSVKNFILHFSPDITSGGQTTWDLSVP